MFVGIVTKIIVGEVLVEPKEVIIDDARKFQKEGAKPPLRLEFGSFFDHFLAAGNGTFIDSKFSLFGFALFGKQSSGIGIIFRQLT